jgi:hypothetical protein
MGSGKLALTLDVAHHGSTRSIEQFDASERSLLRSSGRKLRRSGPARGSEDGLSDFFSLHAALARKNAPRAVLVAFDLIHLDGEDMRGRELEERRAILADVVSKRAPWLQFSESNRG